MSVLSAVLLIGGLAAAVAAVVQIARQSVRLREELDELRERSPAPVPAAKPRGAVQPLFGQLYEDKPGPLDGIGAWPGVPLACAAAGLFAIGMVTNRPEPVGRGPADSTVAVELAAARQRHDSLASTVAQLRDSLAVLQRPSAAGGPAARASAPRPRPAAKRAGPTQLASPASSASAGGVAPLPSLPKIGSP
jgi:hypothetical protein